MVLYFQFAVWKVMVVGLEVAIINEWKEPSGRAKGNKLARKWNNWLKIDNTFPLRLNNYDVRTGKMGVRGVNDFRL